jgi:hypothetical protein
MAAANIPNAGFTVCASFPVSLLPAFRAMTVAAHALEYQEDQAGARQGGAKKRQPDEKGKL